jgi:hypothetical protein
MKKERREMMKKNCKVAEHRIKEEIIAAMRSEGKKRRKRYLRNIF